MFSSLFVGVNRNCTSVNTLKLKLNLNRVLVGRVNFEFLQLKRLLKSTNFAVNCNQGCSSSKLLVVAGHHEPGCL